MQFTSSLTKDHLENTTLTRAKLMLPYFRIKTLKRHTLLDIYTYLSSRYMGVLPPPLPSHTHTHTHTPEDKEWDGKVGAVHTDLTKVSFKAMPGCKLSLS